jgi:hypothetical protein
MISFEHCDRSMRAQNSPTKKLQRFTPRVHTRAGARPGATFSVAMSKP